MTKPTRYCAVEGCARPYRCSGYCGMHYERLRSTGKVDLTQPEARVCMVDGCARAHSAQGYCRAHYKRYLEHGDPLAHVPLKRMPTADQRGDIVGRIMEMVRRDPDGCLSWTGYCMPSGYGTISWNSREWVVHRAMWTAIVGPIPDDDDWTIDHLCYNKVCVNVGHLEVVTRTENSLRAGGLAKAQRRNASYYAERTHCREGHELAAVGTHRSGGCRACSQAAWARQSERINARRRAERAAQDVKITAS